MFEEFQGPEPERTSFFKPDESDGEGVHKVETPAETTDHAPLRNAHRSTTAKSAGGVVEGQPGSRPQDAGEWKPGNPEYVRLRNEFTAHDGRVRFSILQDWVSKNILAIFRRACGDWKLVSDLVAFIPSYLEPVAEIYGGRVLLVGTRGHDERLAIPVKPIDAASEFSQYFEFDRNTNSPAVVVRSKDRFEVISKGALTPAVLARMEACEPKQNGDPALFIIIARLPERGLEHTFQVRGSDLSAPAMSMSATP